MIVARFRVMQISIPYKSYCITRWGSNSLPHLLHHRNLLPIVSKRIPSRDADLRQPLIMMESYIPGLCKSKVAFSDLWIDCPIPRPDLCPSLVFPYRLSPAMMGVAAAPPLRCPSAPSSLFTVRVRTGMAAAHLENPHTPLSDELNSVEWKYTIKTGGELMKLSISITQSLPTQSDTTPRAVTTQSLPSRVDTIPADTPPTAAEQSVDTPPTATEQSVDALPNTAQLYGYVRVSTREQNEARQIIALREFGISPDHVYMDKQSGKDFHRPAWQALMSQLRPGDVLVVKSIDRLGRNYSDILDQWRYITKSVGAAIVVLDMPLLDTRNSRDLTGTLIADIVLQLLSYVAETERAFIRARQAEGIAAARARGVKFGRKPLPRPDSFPILRDQWKNGSISANEASRRLGVGRNTFLRWARE